MNQAIESSKTKKKIKSSVNVFCASHFLSQLALLLQEQEYLQLLFATKHFLRGYSYIHSVSMLWMINKIWESNWVNKFDWEQSCAVKKGLVTKNSFALSRTPNIKYLALRGFLDSSDMLYLYPGCGQRLVENVFGCSFLHLLEIQFERIYFNNVRFLLCAPTLLLAYFLSAASFPTI